MPGFLTTPVPYCGAPPAPEALWSRWNLDPFLILLLLAVLGAYLLGMRQRAQPPAAWRRAAFVAGWSVATAALISPLCPLSVSLFSARVGQHMILTLIAAPLVLLGRPDHAAAALWPGLAHSLGGSRALAWLRSAAGSAAAFALALWFWHAPAPYDATFASPLVYWLMHLTVFGTALMVWSVLLDPTRGRAVAALTVGAISTLQMTFLGALITLTPRSLYPPHAITPYAWGLTPAGDQQLGGLIMWVPGCSIFLTVTLITLAGVMSERAGRDALA